MKDEIVTLDELAAKLDQFGYELSQKATDEAPEKVQLNDDEARGDHGSANSAELDMTRKSPCLSHFCGIRLSEKRGRCRFFCLEKCESRSGWPLLKSVAQQII